MNLRTLLLVGVINCVSALAYGYMQYRSGYSEGQSDLLAEQRKEQEVNLAKQTTRQQADDTKAAVANESGKTKTEVITRDVIKYVKTPGRDVCRFDADRVRIKSDAVKNAATIPGYDDASVQAATAERRP